MNFVHYMMCTMCLGIEDWLELKYRVCFSSKFITSILEFFHTFRGHEAEARVSLWGGGGGVL